MGHRIPILDILLAVVACKASPSTFLWLVGQSGQFSLIDGDVGDNIKLISVLSSLLFADRLRNTLVYFRNHVAERLANRVKICLQVSDQILSVNVKTTEQAAA